MSHFRISLVLRASGDTWGGTPGRNGFLTRTETRLCRGREQVTKDSGTSTGDEPEFHRTLLADTDVEDVRHPVT